MLDGYDLFDTEQAPASKCARNAPGRRRVLVVGDPNPIWRRRLGEQAPRCFAPWATPTSFVVLLGVATIRWSINAGERGFEHDAFEALNCDGTHRHATWLDSSVEDARWVWESSFAIGSQAQAGNNNPVGQ